MSLRENVKRNLARMWWWEHLWVWWRFTFLGLRWPMFKMQLRWKLRYGLHDWWLLQLDDERGGPDGPWMWEHDCFLCAPEDREARRRWCSSQNEEVGGTDG